MLKKILPLALIFVFAGLSFFSNHKLVNSSVKRDSIDDAKYQNGILKRELPNVDLISEYRIKAELLPDLKKIVAEEEIIWVNKTRFPTQEIQLHLYPNAFKNSYTEFAKGSGIKIEKENKSGVVFSEIKINDKQRELTYFQPEVANKFDSTVAKIILDKPANMNDTVALHFKYSVAIPKSGKRFGYASDRNFFFISEWFPKIGVYQDGKWICSQYHPFTGFFSDFSNYNISITVPDNYLVAATGVQKSITKINNAKRVFNYSQNAVHDFAWSASDNCPLYYSTYKRNDGTGIQIKTVLLPENQRYQERYSSAVINALKYLEKSFGVYPYRTLTIIDTPPSTSKSGGTEYPTLLTVATELFSPVQTLEPEEAIIHEFVKQYFYGIVASNEVYDAWLDEGISSYITSEIVNKYYGNGCLNFRFLGYYPIFGLNFISYNEIPLIYTLGSYSYPLGSTALANYYQSPNTSAILDTSYKQPNSLNSLLAANNKPELVFISLERYLGKEKLMEIFLNYYSSYKYRHPVSNDFLSILKEKTKDDYEWIYPNLFKSSSVSDYRINDIKSINYDEYEIYIERIGDGVFKQEVALYTDKDTLIKSWDGQNRWAKVLFKTKNIVVGAELDPDKKNILDLNYANNSYMVKKQIGGSILLSFRWLFWFQNLLLILGSIS